MNLEKTLLMEREIVNEVSALLVKTLDKYDQEKIDRRLSSAIFNSALLKYTISHHINIFIASTTFSEIKPQFLSATASLLDDSYKVFLELNGQ